MSIEEDMVAVLRNDPTLTGLIAGRVYPLQAPDNAATPYVTYQVITTSAYNKIYEAPGLERKVVQLNAIANRFSEAHEIGEAMKRALEADKGYLQTESHEYFNDTQKFRVRIDWSLIG